MSDTANSVGGQGYTSQTTKALNSITESPGPDLSDGEQQFVSMLSRHDYQIKFLAQNDQQLQIGVNQATSNPIKQIQQFIADVQVLVSGAELPKGALDFGDLQYILPAIGALFGFGTGTYPINLFQAAEKFFFGYVVPNQQYTDLQIAGFNSWATQLGIDPTFIKDMDSLTQAFGDLFNGLQNVGPSLASLFDELGISGTDLGPLGQLLAPILQWFAPIDFSKFGSMIEWLTDAIEPWVTGLTAVINWVNSLLAAIGAGGDVVNSPLPQVTIPFENLIKLFVTLDLSDPQFTTAQGWGQLFSEIFTDLEQFGAGVWAWLTGAPINAGNIYGQLSPGVYSNVPATAISTDDTNLLDNAGFEGAISVAGDGIWTWDSIVHYQADDDVVGAAGSVKVLADGTQKLLYSNRVTVGPGKQVALGRQINFSVQALATHLTATGTPVQVGVRTNLGTTVLAQALPVSDPTGSGWVNPPTGSKAGTLAAASPWLVPQDGSVTWFCMVLIVDTTATSGEVRFDDAREVLHGGLIGDLQDDLADLQDDATRANAALVMMLQAWSTAAETYATNFNWTQLITAFQSAWNTYITTITDIEAEQAITIQQIIKSLTGIDITTGMTPAAQVGGVGGLETLEQTLEQTYAQLGAALGGDVANAGGLTWLAQLVNALGFQSNHTQTVASTSASTLSTRTNAPTFAGLDNTTESNMDYHNINTSTPIYMNIGASAVALVRCQKASKIGALVFPCKKTGSPTNHLWINIFRVDYANNMLRYLYSVDAAAAGLIATDAIRLARVVLPGASNFNVEQGDVIMVELAAQFGSAPSSTGFAIYGQPTTGIVGGHPTANMKDFGGYLNNHASGGWQATADIALSNFVPLPATPYVGLEISTLPADYQPPVPTEYGTAGSFTHNLQPWLQAGDIIDLIGLGGSGGGGGFVSLSGYGGGAGVWATRRLIYGTDIPLGTTQLTGTIGNGGAGAVFNPANGGPGGSTIVNGPSGALLTAAAGSGGQTNAATSNDQANGKSPGSKSFEGGNYFGGQVQTSLGSNGYPPGGGGAGGWSFKSSGGDGTVGHLWISEQQAP